MLFCDFTARVGTEGHDMRKLLFPASMGVLALYGASCGVTTVTLDTSDAACLNFGEDPVTCTEEVDFMLEPWCVDNPAVCGNWVQTDDTALGDVTEAPADGYISDAAGFNDCQEAEAGKVLVFKLADDTYAKAIISEHSTTQDDSGCDHTVTLDYVYPM